MQRTFQPQQGQPQPQGHQQGQQFHGDEQGIEVPPGEYHASVGPHGVSFRAGGESDIPPDLKQRVDQLGQQELVALITYALHALGPVYDPSQPQYQQPHQQPQPQQPQQQPQQPQQPQAPQRGRPRTVR